MTKWDTEQSFRHRLDTLFNSKGLGDLPLDDLRHAVINLMRNAWEDGYSVGYDEGYEDGEDDCDY